MSKGLWNPLTIRRYVESIATSTRVARVETDQGEGFLKALGNPEGPHVLACELVGTLLAEWLGLSTLDFAVIDVAPEDEIPFAAGGCASPGPAFITRAEIGFSWGGDEATLHKLANTGDIAGLVVLDTWIRNCDRHQPPPNLRINLENVFLTRSGKSGKGLLLKSIDHTHAFTCGRELSQRLNRIEDIHDQTVFGCFPEFLPFLTRDGVGRALARLAEMTPPMAASVVSQVPPEWQVDEPVRAAWVRFIADRARFVASHIEEWIWPFATALESR